MYTSVRCSYMLLLTIQMWNIDTEYKLDKENCRFCFKCPGIIIKYCWKKRVSNWELYSVKPKKVRYLLLLLSRSSPPPAIQAWVTLTRRRSHHGMYLRGQRAAYRDRRLSRSMNPALNLWNVMEEMESSLGIVGWAGPLPPPPRAFFL